MLDNGKGTAALKAAAAAALGKARGAVMDRNAVMDPTKYEKKIVAKDPAVREMLAETINSNILFR